MWDKTRWWRRSLAQAEKTLLSKVLEFLKSQHLRFPRHSRRGGCIKFAIVLQQVPKELERKKKNYEFYVNLLLIKD